jgi:PilZ domain
MGLTEWLKTFRTLHEQAKRKGLAGRDLDTYYAARDELARAMLAAQHVALQPGAKPRRHLRVSRALQADLDFPDGHVRAMTLDISAGGFAALLAKPPRGGEDCKVSLRIPGGDPLVGEARVIEVKALPGNARAAFEFVGLSTEDSDRVEMFVFDAVLAQLQG